MKPLPRKVHFSRPFAPTPSLRPVLPESPRNFGQPETARPLAGGKGAELRRVLAAAQHTNVKQRLTRQLFLMPGNAFQKTLSPDAGAVTPDSP